MNAGRVSSPGCSSQRRIRMSRVLDFHGVADDDSTPSTSTSDDDDDDDVMLPVVIGGRRGRGTPRRGNGAYVAAPEETDSEDEKDEASRRKKAGDGQRGGSSGTDGDGEEDEERSDGTVVMVGIGERTLVSVGRARQDAFERARERRERAKATARRRIESLELELTMARDVETMALEENLRMVEDIRRRLMEADEAFAADASKLRQTRARVATEARKETDALVMRAVAADAEAREAAERARVEEEKRVKAEEEAAKKKAEEEEAAAKLKAEEEAKKKAAEEEAKRAQAASDYVSGKTTGGEVPRVAAASEALEQETTLAKTLAEARATVAEYQAHPGARMERRKLTNAIVVHVQQIAATKEQINKKSRDIMMLLVQLQEPQKTFALLSIAKKMLSQCDVQVAKLNRYAFALAEVAVRIACDVPRFGALLVALIHEVCVSSVPKYYPFVPGRYATDEEYYGLMGYTKTEEGAFETTDAYIDRMTGVMLFYAAFVQVEAPNHPHGVDAAWRWLARLLNRCPPNRYTAAALDSFLKIAGYRMHNEYRGQFVKVLELIHREFIPKLDAKNEPDIRPVSSRMKTYLQESLYAKAPEGRDMPNTDTSSTTF